MASSDRPSKITGTLTYMVDSAWSYPEVAQSKIAKALNDTDHLTPKQLGALLNEITYLAQWYRAWTLNEKAHPTSGEIRKQVKNLEQRICDLRHSLANLSAEAHAYLDEWAFEIDGQSVTPMLLEASKVLARSHSTIGAIADKAAKRGSPKKGARLRFIFCLAKIWAAAHDGTWPTRLHDWKTAQDYGPFRDFALACHDPLGFSPAGIDDNIRTVCSMGKKDCASD